MWHAFWYLYWVHFCSFQHEADPMGSVFSLFPECRGVLGSVGLSRSIGADPPSVLCSVQPLPKGDQVLNFSDAEDLIDDSKLK